MLVSSWLGLAAKLPRLQRMHMDSSGSARYRKERGLYRLAGTLKRYACGMRNRHRPALSSGHSLPSETSLVHSTAMLVRIAQGAIAADHAMANMKVTLAAVFSGFFTILGWLELAQRQQSPFHLQ